VRYRSGLNGIVTLALALTIAAPARAADAQTEAAIDALRPEAESYIAAGMQKFDLPGLAIGVVANDNLVYSKGFGVRRKSDASAVDPRTVFQIGSATKGFLSATMALMVDRGKFKWDDRVIDLDDDFRLKDAWVTREFRVFDLLAQRSGLPPYVNDVLGILGLDRTTLVRSLLGDGLLDELRLFVHPISRGSGQRLLDELDVMLRLAGSRAFETGVLDLRYVAA